MRRVWITLGLLMLLLWGGFTPRNAAQAGALQARLDQFPHWR